MTHRRQSNCGISQRIEALTVQGGNRSTLFLFWRETVAAYLVAGVSPAKSNAVQSRINRCFDRGLISTPGVWLMGPREKQVAVRLTALYPHGGIVEGRYVGIQQPC